MARGKGSVSTLMMLIMFLLSIALLVFGSLYFEAKHKNRLLAAQVEQLQKSQVLLMVPDEQAVVMAEWMSSNPDFVSSFVTKAQRGRQTSIAIGPGVAQTRRNPAELEADSQADLKAKISTQPDRAQVPLPQAKLAGPELDSQPGPKVKTQTLAERSSETVMPDKGKLQLIDSPVIGTVVNRTRDPGPDTPEKTIATGVEPAKEFKMLSENEQGVKVISLPHGGRRVTTGDANE